MKQKLFTLLIAVMASVGMSFAETYSGSCGENLTWSLNTEDGVLTISGTGAMADYEYVDGGFSSAPWNDYRETISSLEFQLGVTSIGEYAFYQCRHLTTVTLPSSVISIGRNAFDGCANLISATIPNSVTTIGWYAFSDCTNLSSVTIPESVTELGIWPFQHCSGLTSIDVASTNPEYSSTDGVLFYKTESSLLKYPAGKPSASYIIPDNTASISDFAFEGSTHLTSVTIPNSVTDIRSYAFRNCENLASLTIPNSVTRIGGYAFLYCTSLTSVICKAITPPTIASTAFYGVDISIPLYVPAQSVAAYQAADVWKEFGNILAIEDTPEPCIIASGTCGAQGDNLTWTLSCDSVLTISGTGAMDDYYSYESIPWYEYIYTANSIKSVIIQEGVTHIGQYAFRNCHLLASVSLANSLTSIGSGAFSYCGKLPYVKIPSSVTNLGIGVFEGCPSMSAFEVSEANPNFCSVDGVLFDKNISTLMQYPPSKTNTTYSIPSNVVTIAETAFWCSRNLTIVTIPNGVASIGSSAFLGCSGLTSVTIPNSVATIGQMPFVSCTNLPSIDVDPGNPYFCSIDGVLFNKDKTNLIEYPIGKAGTSYVIPDGVIVLGNGAFEDCTSLISVTIPSSVESIGDFCFAYCRNLRSVTNYATLPQNIIGAGLSADTLYVPAQSVEAYKAADVWKEFTNILPIGESSDSCVIASGTCGAEGDNLTWTLTCDSVLTISGTGAMADYEVSSNKTPWDSNRESIKSIVIEDDVTSIGNDAFFDCIGLTSIEIPNSVTSIGDGAFSQCFNLSSVTIGNNVAYIGTAAFYHCSFTTLEIPASVQSIGDWALESSELSQITVAENNSNYCAIDGVLYNKDTTLIIRYPQAKLDTTYVIPRSVTSIGRYAIRGSVHLTSMDIPNSLISIQLQAFQQCANLMSVKIPESITTIENYAFRWCNSLTSVTNYSISPQTINSNVFENINLSACTLYVPAQSLAAYQTADVWKEFGNIVAIDDSTEEVNYATLADIYNMAADSAFTLGAFDVVYVPSFQNGSNMYIKDSTGSCVIYKVNYGLQAGDHVEAGLQGKVSIYHGLHEIAPVSTKEELTITSGEAPAPMEATEVPSATNVNQYVIYKGVSFSTDTAFVEGKRHAVNGIWNGQTITFYNQYYMSATLSAGKTYNIIAVNTIYGTILQAYPLAVEEVSSDTPDSCLLASGTCGAQGDNLTWTLSCDSVLTISGTGAMADYNNADNMPAPWFQYHTFIQSVIIEDGITSIGFEAFWECDNLQSVDIPNSVVNIEAGAFCNCYNLESVTIPSSVTNIGTFAFYNCHRLTSITIPSSVATLGRSPFGSCINVPSIEVANDNPNYCSVDGVLFNKQQTILIQYPAGKANSTYTIPSSVTDIQYCAFSSCSWLNTITIGNHVTNIDAQAFYGCSGLTSMVIPNSITKIGDHTFYNCTSLISVTIPSSVMSIGEGAFAYCRSLTSVTNYATEPQVIVPITFYYVNLSSCTLYVPAQSIAAYQTADVWKEFGTILPIEGELPIEPTEGEFNVLYVGQDGDSISSEPVMLHVPVAPVIEGFTFLKWVIVAGDLEDGIAIQAVYEADMQTGTPEVYTNPANHAQKLLRNGHVYILTDDRTYTIQGQRTK